MATNYGNKNVFLRYKTNYLKNDLEMLTLLGVYCIKFISILCIKCCTLNIPN